MKSEYAALILTVAVLLLPLTMVGIVVVCAKRAPYPAAPISGVLLSAIFMIVAVRIITAFI